MIQQVTISEGEEKGSYFDWPAPALQLSNQGGQTDHKVDH